MKENQLIDRRSFIGLAAAGAVASGTLLSGCSPKTGEDSDRQTELLASTSRNSIERVPGEETVKCDVAIVGAGAAGLMSALKLAQNGKKVVVIEKGSSAAASNFSMCGGPAACGSKLQASEGVDLTTLTMFRRMFDDAHASVNGALLHNILACTGEAINSMMNLGIEMFLNEDQYAVGFRARHLFISDGPGRTDPIVRAVEEQGGEFLFSTAGEKLITEDGEVKGVQTDAGIDVMANAVVVCTGGFGGNEDMLKEHFNTPVYALGNPGSDGKGIEMVLDAGGVLDRNFAILGNELGALPSSVFDSSDYPLKMNDEGIWINGNEHYGWWLFGGLFTDPAGNRFIDEGKIAAAPLAIGGEALVRNGKCYAVIDTDYLEGVIRDGVYAFLGSPQDWVAGLTADLFSPTQEKWQSDMQIAIEEGWGCEAGTINEIAGKFGLDNLVPTVERYNSLCEASVDEDFGKATQFLKPIKKGPFYAFEYIPSGWSTNGGVKVDSQLRALNADNNPIANLYVAGVDQGSSYTTPYYSNDGASVGVAMGSGILAADSILSRQA